MLSCIEALVTGTTVRRVLCVPGKILHLIIG
jgi:hypothetical protein